MFQKLFYKAWNQIQRLMSGAQIQYSEPKPERVRIEDFGKIAYFGMNSLEENPYWQGTPPAIILAKVVFTDAGSANLFTAPRNQDDKNEILHDYLGYVFRTEADESSQNGKHINGEMHFLHRVEP
jgi:hypothetical protein